MATNSSNLNQNTINALMGIQSTLSQLSQALRQTYAPGTQVTSSISQPLMSLLGGFSSGGGSSSQPRTSYSAPSVPYSTPTIAKSQPSAGGNKGIKVTGGYYTPPRK